MQIKCTIDIDLSDALELYHDDPEIDFAEFVRIEFDNQLDEQQRITADIVRNWCENHRDDPLWRLDDAMCDLQLSGLIPQYCHISSVNIEHK